MLGFLFYFPHRNLSVARVCPPVVAKPVKQCYRERNWGRERGAWRKYGKSEVNAINERKINLPKLDKLMRRI